MTTRTIDFLPVAYQKAEARKRRNLRAAAVILVGVVLMGGWFLSARRERRSLASYAESLETQVETIQGQTSEVNRLGIMRTNLERQIQLRDRLSWPVDVAQITAAVTEQVPSSIALTHLSISGRRPQVRTPEAAAANLAAAVAAAKPAAPAREVVTVEITGIAPHEDAVADLVGRLSSYPLFDEVTMHFSRPTEEAGVRGRAFHIEMKVPMDRRYVPKGGGA